MTTLELLRRKARRRHLLRLPVKVPWSLLREGWQAAAGLYILSQLTSGDPFVVAVLMWLCLAALIKLGGSLI